MINLRIVYNYRYKVWELYHEDVNEMLAQDKNIYNLILVADSIAKLIKPSRVVFIPQEIIKEILINEYC
ncbi:hypothetical protein [Haloplasma contractile]|uniref:hypothetical protein n=1 Tax=Haloplasma contractile TaxID=471825 RepID=UPI0002121589|nr:hypothetical protein [Haloplasma contractile]